MRNYESTLFFRQDQEGIRLRDFYLEKCKGSCIPSTENRLLVERFKDGTKKSRDFYKGAEEVRKQIELLLES